MPSAIIPTPLMAARIASKTNNPQNIRLKPDGHEPYIYRGKAYRAVRGTDRAIADFTAAARVNPRSGWGHCERASTYWMTSPNMPATTLKDIDDAIRREPHNPNYYNFRGVVFTATDNFRRAIADFDRAIALKPTMAIATVTVGSLNTS